MLAVSNGSAAIDFYKKAFGATELWRVDAGGHVVAGLSVNGAELFLAQETPSRGTRAPDAVGYTRVRTELFVDDPQEVQSRAIAAGAIEWSPVEEHTSQGVGPRPIRRMLQGGIVDPFGHNWLPGKVME